MKRFLNSVITFYYRSNKKLNPIDTITIETIKMYNIELYQSIIENKRYFISEDKINTNFLITHRIKLDDILKGYEIFDKKEDNCIKIAVHSN